MTAAVDVYPSNTTAVVVSSDRQHTITLRRCGSPVPGSLMQGFNTMKPLNSIQKEFETNIDNYSNDLIVTAIEQLLNYSQRFYGRKFITRHKMNSDLVTNLERLIKQYFQDDIVIEKGLPTVEYFASKLNLSTSYLSDLVKKKLERQLRSIFNLKLSKEQSTNY